jgi:hypothetical protein
MPADQGRVDPEAIDIKAPYAQGFFDERLDIRLLTPEGLTADQVGQECNLLIESGFDRSQNAAAVGGR